MKYNIAVIGATGNVGGEILKTLSERKFPVNHVVPLATISSRGKNVSFGEKETLSVKTLENFDFAEVDIAFFSAGEAISEKYAHKATEKGCIVIDNTSHFRMHPEVPLIIPEINPNALQTYTKHNIISNPNCSTIQMLMGIKPLHNIAKIKRIVVSTYQAVSGAGKAAMDELYTHTKCKFTNQKHEAQEFPKPITFNCIPHIDDFMPDGKTKEEWKMEVETQKILDANITVSATCVRVPVFTGHAESVNVELEKEISLEEATEAFNEEAGVILTDRYITQIEVAQEDAVYVSRLRVDNSTKNAFNMWIVADNLRKGAALNAVQIAEHIINT